MATRIVTSYNRLTDYTNATEATLAATLTGQPVDTNIIYNTDLATVRIWNGTAFANSPALPASFLGASGTPSSSNYLRGDMSWGSPAGAGTVTNVTSADGSVTITNPTSTPDLAVVKAPKLTTGRTIAITGDIAYTSPAFDGSANVTGAGTLATVNSNVGTFTNSTVTVNAKGLVTAVSSGAGGSLTLTQVEVDLGSTPINSGNFTITSSGLTSGKSVLIHQSVGAYTGKGTLADESEMDSVIVKASTISTTQIKCYWNSTTLVRSNFKFDYIVSS